MRRGLSDILATEVLLFVGQCSHILRPRHTICCRLYSSVVGRASTILHKRQRRPASARSTDKLGKDLQLTWRRVSEGRAKNRAPAVLTDAISASRRPGCSSRRRCRARRPWAASRTLWLWRWRTARGSHAVWCVRVPFVYDALTPQPRRHAPLFFEEPGLSIGVGEVFPAQDSPDVVDRLLAFAGQ